MVSKPVVSDDPLYLLLKDGRVGEFNRRKAAGEVPDLCCCDFSGMDLRGMDAEGLNLQQSVFHQSDLRGVDLRGADLDGSSIHEALIADAWFPPAFSAAEIELSLEHGTRLRRGC